MAKADDNVVTKGMRGAIGKDIVYRTFKTGTFSGKFPDMSKVIPSKNQTKRRTVFADAVTFAKSVMKDPNQISKFNPDESQSPYHAAIKHYMRFFSKSKTGAVKLSADWKAALEALSLNESQFRAVVFLDEYKKLTNRFYQKLNNVSKATATRHLRELTALNIIQSNDGKGAGAFYTPGTWWMKK